MLFHLTELHLWGFRTGRAGGLPCREWKAKSCNPVLYLGAQLVLKCIKVYSWLPSAKFGYFCKC